MLASSQLDLVVGLDIHMEMVPTPAPVPMPFPMPFVGQIEFDAGGVLLSAGIGAAMSAVFGDPPKGPVLVNNFQSTKTGDEAKNAKTMPHIVIPPGTMWTPLPKPLKLKMKPGPPPPPDNPAKPPGDAIMVTGSKTVYFEESNACRLGTLAMSCSDPVRLPSSTLLAIPKGLPVLVGGPDTFDWATAAKTFLLRNKWTAGLLHQIVDLLPPGRLRNLFHMGACFLTGHPVDVATGRLLANYVDIDLDGPIPIRFERFYSSAWAERDSAIGFGWSHSFDERVWVERGRIVYKTGDGRELQFSTLNRDNDTIQTSETFTHPFEAITLENLGNDRWRVRTADGLAREFAPLAGETTSRLFRVHDRLGHWLALTYEFGHLDTIRSSEGHYLRIEHRDGRIVRVALPTPHEETGGWFNAVMFEYSSNGDLVGSYDSARHARTFDYANHLLIRDTDRDNVAFYFEYDGIDSSARCVRTWGSDGITSDRIFFRELSFDTENRRTIVENSLGHKTAYAMNIANAVTSIIAPDGGVTTFSYDERLRKISETDALGNTTCFEYDSRGNETARILPNGAKYSSAFDEQNNLTRRTDPFGVEWIWAYDDLGRIVQAQSSAGERVSVGYQGKFPRYYERSDGRRIELVHNALGQPTQIVKPDGYSEERTYDRLGRLIKIRDGEGRAIRAIRDLEGQVVELQYTGGGARRIWYTAGGDVARVTEPGRTETYGYTNFHRLAWREEAGERTSFEYDTEGNLVTLTNARAEQYRFERDANGRVLSETTFEGRRTEYIRDYVGNAISTLPPSKRAKTTTYDIFSNPIQVTYADGEVERFVYDVAGNLISATNSNGTVHFDLDSRRNVVRERFGNDEVESFRDSTGGRIGIRTSRGVSVATSRNPMGFLQTVAVSELSLGGRTTLRWQGQIGRNSFGGETGRALPAGVTSRWSLDPAGRPETLEIRRPGESVDRIEYEWSGLESLARERDSGGNELVYTHDPRGRLASSTDVRSGVTAWRAPDAIGNLYRSPTRTDRRYGKGGVLLADGDVKLAYDASGNLIRKEWPDGTVQSYEWSDGGLLKRVISPDGSTTSFSYDALRRRIAKSTASSETTWIWDGIVPIHELHSTVKSTKLADEECSLTTWIFDDSIPTPIAKLSNRGVAHSVLSDVTGTPIRMVDSEGKLAWSARINSFGQTDCSIGKVSDCPWRRPGQYEDTETGLYYNVFRYYDSQSGSYISQDPIGLLGCDATGNPYSYTAAPNAIVDPLGLAGFFHPVTGVWVSGGGNPAFPSVFDVRLPAYLRGADISDYRQMTHATEQLAKAIERNPDLAKEFSRKQLEAIAAGKQRIPGFTWHHNHNGSQLQLVDRWLHSKTGHEGGRAKKDGGRC